MAIGFVQYHDMSNLMESTSPQRAARLDGAGCMHSAMVARLARCMREPSRRHQGAIKAPSRGHQGVVKASSRRRLYGSISRRSRAAPGERVRRMARAPRACAASPRTRPHPPPGVRATVGATVSAYSWRRVTTRSATPSLLYQACNEEAGHGRRRAAALAGG